MNQRLLSAIGVLALIVWTLGGVAAWVSTKQGLHITVREGSGPDKATEGVALLEDRVTSLEKDLAGLAKALGQNFQRLQANLSDESGENRTRIQAQLQEIEDQITALRTETRSEQTVLARRAANMTQQIAHLAEMQKDRPVVATPTVTTPAATSPAGSQSTRPVPKPVAIAPRAASPQEKSTTKPKQAARPPRKKRRGFLSFDLPSQTVAFDKRQTWKLIPSLSRVGFDGKSTLHNFSGVSSRLSGTIEVDLSHPGKHPSARIEVQASTLETGVAGRNAEMYATLDTKKHPQIQFDLLSFAGKSVDAKLETVVGVVHGTMTIRGARREVDMPTTLHIDSSRRLHIAGEMPLDLTDYGIKPPSKMGLIGMNKLVKVWVRLRARIQAPK